MERIQCEICGELFVKHRRAKTCSNECSLKLKSIRYKERVYGYSIRPNIKCCICGNEFSPHSSRQSTCSLDCVQERKRRYLRVNRERWAERARAYGKAYRKNNPEVNVKAKIKYRLGVAPDDEHVELCLIRRDILRAIKKAGE